MTADESPTWIACLTPPGQSALATLGLYGPRAWQALRAVFRPRSGGELPPEPIAGRFWLGRLGGEVADEVVAAVKRSEPVAWLEVHGHGGGEVVRFLIDTLREHGLQPCGWEDFLRRTGADPLSAAAAVALAHAETVRTAAVLLDQQQGALGRALDAIRSALDGGDTAEAAEGLARLTRYAPVGRRLTRPWRVAVAGAPNVGKSSLVNALAGYQRSIVSATPGTTRDVVTTRLALDGWPVELADTAGLRTEAEALEGQGIERARSAVAGADLCLWVLDATTLSASGGRKPPVEEVTGSNVLYVVNKCDLASAAIEGAMHVSAKTGQGLGELCEAIVSRLVPDPPPPGAAVPFTPGICNGVLAARNALTGGDAAGTREIVDSLRQAGGLG